MTTGEAEIFNFAVKLLARRDYSVIELREKLELRFGQVPEPVIERLLFRHFLNDRRFAENHVARYKKRGHSRLKQELLVRGISPEIAEEVLSRTEWPSLRDALKAKMVVWKLSAPLQPGEAARLFRAMARLGYEEDAIREEVEQLTS